MAAGNYNLSLIKRFLHYFKPHTMMMGMLLILMVISSIGSLATPFVLKIIIDDIFPNGNYGDLIWILLGLIFIYILRILSSSYADVLDTKISQRVVADIRDDLYDNLLNKDVLYFQNINPGDVIYTLVDDVRNIQKTLSTLIMSLMNDVFTLLGIIIMLAYLDINLTMLSLLLIPVMLFVVRRLTPYVQASFKEIQNEESKLSSFFLQSISNIRVIKSYATFFDEKKRLSDISFKIYESSRKSTVWETMNSGIVTFVIAISPVLVLLLGGKQVFTGTLTLGALVAFIQYVNRLYSPTLGLIKTYNLMSKAMISMERVDSYLRLEDNKEKVGALPKSITAPLVQITKISFERVFYRKEGKIILRNMNITFERGKIYAVVGASGSGKSTLVNLICGFIQDYVGDIWINDTLQIQSITEWNRYLGLIEKENQLFSDTLRENIFYGNDYANETDYEEALELALLTSVIKQSNLNDQSPMSASGSSLSDGQKQRISIARAFLRKPQLIIFDESTSSLDVDLENRLLRNIRTKFSDSIVIIVTHRPSTVQQVDVEYKIDAGEVISCRNINNDTNHGVKKQPYV